MNNVRTRNGLPFNFVDGLKVKGVVIDEFFTGQASYADNLAGVPDKVEARNNLNVPSKTGTGAAGTWDIDITGNADTASVAGSLSGTLATVNGGTGATTAKGAFDNIKQYATDVYNGVVQLADTTEAITGTANDVVMTPLKTAQALPALLSSMSSGGVGTYAFAASDLDKNFGDTISGMSLTSSGAIWKQEVGGGIELGLWRGSIFAGTWRCMGYQTGMRTVPGQQTIYGATLWQRIA